MIPLRKVRITKQAQGLGWFCLLPNVDPTGAPYDAVLCADFAEAIRLCNVFIQARQIAAVSQPLRIQ